MNLTSIFLLAVMASCYFCFVFAAETSIQLPGDEQRQTPSTETETVKEKSEQKSFFRKEIWSREQPERRERHLGGSYPHPGKVVYLAKLRHGTNDDHVEIVHRPHYPHGKGGKGKGGKGIGGKGKGGKGKGSYFYGKGKGGKGKGKGGYGFHW
mmetsp:Transcript_28244/g.40445  ORF Transcript_28244/g.40445 Transcript_28244/m.40445 type:complete len:153 (-) Transcript_28244:211-669(-)